MSAWTDDEVRRLKEEYAKPIPALGALAAELGRHKTNVCRKAKSLGLTDQRRIHVLPEDKKIQRPKFSSQEERSAAMSVRVKAYFAANGHPRGALGMKHTDEAKKKISESLREAYLDPNHPCRSEAMRQLRSDSCVERTLRRRTQTFYSRSASGTREDLGIYVRSAWEANYARYLNFLKASGQISGWRYEPKTFEFVAIKRGTRTYTPDFEVTLPDGRVQWHEVKGWMDQKSRTRLDRMAKYFPNETVLIIGEKWFRDAYWNGLSGTIQGWESQGRGNRGC